MIVDINLSNKEEAFLQDQDPDRVSLIVEAIELLNLQLQIIEDLHLDRTINAVWKDGLSPLIHNNKLAVQDFPPNHLIEVMTRQGSWGGSFESRRYVTSY